MANSLQLETPEQKRLRIEQEKLQQQMGNIGFSSIESSAPVETTAPPKQTALDFVKSFEQTVPSYEENIPVSSYKPVPTTDSSFNFEDFRTKANQKAIIDREIQQHDYSKPYSVTDLELGKGPRNEEGESFIEVAERFLPSIGENEDIKETMRDSDWSVGDAIALGMKSKNWSFQQKKDYAFLRPVWNDAELNDWGEILEATKDIGIDIIADPMNLFFAYLTVQTGGAAALALTSGAKIATNQAVKQGMLKLANNGTFRATSIGLTEGAYDASTINLGNQLTEVNTGLRKELDKTELGISTAIGAGAGLILGPAAYKTTNYLLRRKTQKVLDDLKIEMDKGPVTPKIFEEYNSTLQFFDSIMSNTTGKATSKFIEVSKVSPVIKQFILGLNPKALQRITTARSDIIDAPIRATSREGDLGYSTDQERLSGLYTTFIDEVLDSDIFGRVRDRGNGWWNLGTALDTNDNLSLAYLLTKGDLLDNYIRVTPINPNKPFVNLQVQNKVKNIVPDSRITEMQEKYGLEFNEEIYEAAAKIRYFFKQIEVDAKNIEGIRPDGSFRMTALLDEEQSIPNYFHRILDYDAITATPESRKIFRDMLVRSGHADPINTVKKDDVVIVEEAVKMKGSGGREKDIPDIARSPRRTAYIEDNTIDKEYFKDLDSPFIEGQKILERFDSFEDLALDVLRKENGNLDEASILQRAKELKADALMRKLEEEQYFKTTSRTSTGGKTEFLNNRVWYMLDDEELISNGFVNTNMLPLLKDYGYTMGQKITEAKYFGFGSNFRREWIPEIKKELERSKKFNRTEINKILSQLEKIKDLAVGSPNSQVKLPTRLINTLDVIRTTQVLAHLPFAAVSSITEPFIALSKADLLSDTPSFVKEYAKAGIQQIRKNIGVNGNLWKQISLSTGRKVYGFKNLTDEEFLDMKRWGVAVEQSMQTRIEGMFAENIQSKSARNLNNMFFNLNLLQPWTQAVQMGSFNFAKARTIRITRELTEGKTQFGRKLTKNEIKRRREQLHEIGIDYQDSINAYQNSIVNGKFDLKTFQNQAFYDTQLNPGAQLFAKEVILNPSASNLNKPAWFSNPFAQLAFQFAGYPTAFNNTVLKGFARELTRYPLQSAPSILAATTMMIGTAHLANTLRSRGDNLNNDDQTLLLNAVERPGLLGSASHIYRFNKGQKYSQGFVGGITKAFGGPFLSDYTDSIQYSSSPYEVAIQNAPFWGALSSDTKREWRRYSKNKYHDHFGKPKKDIRSLKRKGGIVEDVLNVKSEPDEVKMRGLPYTYSELAGPLFQDEEERGAFAEGGEATSIKDKDAVYNYLTKDEDEYNVFIDKDLIRTYTKETLPDLDIKDTYYTGFKGNTVSDRLNSVRQSSTIGLPVTTDKTKARGGVKASGKIKFKNVLKLDINSITPDSVQAEINKNIDSIIKIEDKVLGKEIINTTTDNLKLRDAVLNKDENVTNEKKRVIERNKSFLVRHQLLKLGYDALETKEGYVLLRENQFLPTEIMERKNRLTGRLNYRYGKKVKPVEEVSDISPREFFEREQENWESDHGSIPVPTNDAGEKHLPIEERTKDIGFGHKITPKEMEAGLIHGILFINKETGEFIDLIIEDKRFIKKQDNLTLVARARAEGWDKKLQERGLSWETISDKYKLPLEDIAFNVKDPQQWNNIFDKIKNDNVAGFVKELRRKDAGQNTAGMDNRAAKAAAASGLITSYQQALDYGLELTTERRLPFLSKIFERQQYGLGGYMIDWFNKQMEGKRDKLNRSTKGLDLDTAGVRENKLAKKVRRPIESDIKAAEDMINTESEADIIHRGGILGRDAIDLDRVEILSDPKNKYLRGFYNREKTQSRIRDYSTMFEESGKSYEDSKEDYVYIVGHKNANPYVLSHEFRHRAFPPEEMDETTNRLYDAFYARNQKELNQVLNDMLPSKREAFLKRLDKYVPLIIGREVLQLREEHIELLKKLKEMDIPFPKKIDWDLERKRLIEQYNFRAKNTTRKQLGLGGMASALNRRQQYVFGGLTKLFTKMAQRQIKKSRQAVKNNPTASTNSALELDEKLNNLFRKFGDQEYIDEGMPSLENLKQDNQAGFYFSKTNSGNYRLSEIEYDEFNNPKKLKHTIYKINKNLANEEDVNREVVRLGLDVGEKLGYIPQEIFPENMLYDYVPKELHKIYGLE